VIPIADGENVLYVVHVIEISVRIMDNQSLPVAIRVAEIGMAMVPVSPVLIDGKIVREAGSRWDGTLGDHAGAVHVVCAVLEHAMEVYAGTFVAEAVIHVDHQTISFVDLDFRKWP